MVYISLNFKIYVSRKILALKFFYNTLANIAVLRAADSDRGIWSQIVPVFRKTTHPSFYNNYILYEPAPRNLFPKNPNFPTELIVIPDFLRHFSTVCGTEIDTDPKLSFY